MLKHIFLIVVAMMAGSQTARAQTDARPVVPDARLNNDAVPTTPLPSIFFVGDSTMNASGISPVTGRAMRGWAMEVGAFFDKGKINVVNRGAGGRSSRTYQTEGKWDAVVKAAKPGDYIVVQFGHNDGGRYDDPASKGRPSLKGEGEESAPTTRPDGSIEQVHTFGWYMRKYGVEGKAHGATVIFCSMVPHKNWKQASERPQWVAWTRNTARTTGALYVDMNAIIAAGYDQIGAAKVETFFADATTHVDVEGAQFNAAHFIAGVRALPNSPLEAFLNEKGKAIAPATQPAN